MDTLSQIFRKIRNGFWEKEESNVIEGAIADKLLERLATELEDYKLDFKRELPSDSKKTGKLISAISNEGGGVILYGISNEKEIIGIEGLESISERIVRIVRDKCNPVPEIRSIKIINSNKKEILAVLIPHSPDSLISYNGVYYKRIADSTEQLTEKEFRDRETEIQSFKDNYSVIWESSSDLTPIEVLGNDRGSPQGGFREFYEKRAADEILLNLTQQVFENDEIQPRNLLITGKPLSGKSRLVYEWFRSNKKIDVLIPNYDFEFKKSIIIPRNSKLTNKKIVYLDDLNLFYRNKKFILWFTKLLSNEDINIIATCRSGFVFENIKNAMLDEHNIDIESIFGLIKIEDIDLDFAQELAKQLEISWNDIEFDGTIGSILLKLKEIRRRYRSECSKNAKIVLKSLRYLYLAGLFLLNGFFNINHIQRICKSNFLEYNIKKHELLELLLELKTLEFIVFYNEDIVIAETIYLERIVDIPNSFSLNSYNETLTIFSNDPEALYILANNMDSYSDSIVKGTIKAKLLASKAYCKTLTIWTEEKNPKMNALVNRELGILYSSISVLIDKGKYCKKALECYTKSLIVYTEAIHPFDFYYIQYLQSIIFDSLASIEEPLENSKLALDKAKKSNTYFIKQDYPYILALTLNAVGNAYLRIAEFNQKDLVDNCNKAIEAYNKALDLFTLVKFPKDFAMIQNNLSSAYGYLANRENPIENTLNSINALNEALKVRKKDQFPIDYATTKNNLGTSYDTLAQYFEFDLEFDKSFDFFEKAIISYEESLSIRTQEILPVPYATTLTNLSLTYIHYSDTIHRRLFSDRFFLTKFKENLEKSIDYIEKAIEGLNKTIEIYTKEEYPYQYSLIKTNIGNAYTSLAEKNIDSDESCKKAIQSYEDALVIRTITAYPIEYGEVQLNLGIAYTAYAKVCNQFENCKKALEAYDNALKIYNKTDFPHQFNLIHENINRTKDVCQRYFSF